jgi:putative peptidoglycan lipid II flippase
MSGTSRQTVQLTLLSVLGVVLAFGNSIFVGYFYGASEARDAYLVAQTVPSYIALVFSGNVALLFVSTFVRRLGENRDHAWRLASSVIFASTAILAFIALVTIYAAPEIVAWIAPTYNPERRALTASILRILMPSTLFGGATGMISSLYYAERRFLLPSLVPLLNPLIAVVTNVVLHRSLGILGLAVGATLGSLVTVAIMLPGILVPGKLRVSFNLSEPALGRVFLNSLPLTLAGLVYHFNEGFERMLSSRLPVGSVSYLGYASQLKLTLAGVTVTGVAKTIVPAMSQAWALGDLSTVRRYYATGLRSVLMVSLPTAAMLGVFGSTIVGTLFERGAFTHETTVAVTTCLQASLVGYVSAALGSVAANCFYITHRTLAPAFYTVCETALYLALGWYLTGWYSYVGLAIAVSIRDTVSVVVYLYFARRSFDGVGDGRLVSGSLKLVASTLGFGLTALGVREGLTGLMPKVLVAIVGGAAGSAVYLWLAASFFRIDEVSRLLVILRLRRQQSQ